MSAFPQFVTPRCLRATTFSAAAGHFLAAHWRWRTFTLDKLRAFQDERVQRIVAHANQHSPFYRAQWRGCSRDDWRNLPLVDKGLMMDNFDCFNTVGIRRQEAMDVALRAEQTREFAPAVQGLTVGLSSGTSGHRGLFLVSPQEQAAWAGVILARALHKLEPRRTRVAFFLRSHSNLYAQVNGALLQLRYFDLMAPLAQSIAALNDYQPHIVVGPPSLLGFLASAQAEGTLHIRLQRLIGVAEVLEDHDAMRLESCFQAPVHQVYQCTEGLLAVSCAHGSLHIQEDIVAIQCEPLPAEPPELPRAMEGATARTTQSVQRVTPIVTDLWRRTQPIIRYRLDDVLQMTAKPCACGSCFRTIDRIEGRCDDVCYFLERDGARRPFFPDTIRRMVLLAAAGIADYRALQTRDGQLHVHLALHSNTDTQAVCQAVATSVTATVLHYGCRAPAVVVDAELPPLPPGSKRRRVQRLQSS